MTVLPVRLQDVNDANVQQQTLSFTVHCRDASHPEGKNMWHGLQTTRDTVVEKSLIASAYVRVSNFYIDKDFYRELMLAGWSVQISFLHTAFQVN